MTSKIDLFVRFRTSLFKTHRRVPMQTVINHMAKVSGIIVSRQTYSKYEEGEWKMTLDTFQAICLALNMDWKKILLEEIALMESKI